MNTASTTTLASASRALAPGRKVRVMMCVNSLRRGGAEEHMLHLLSGLDRERFEPYLGCPREFLDQVPDLPPDVGVFTGSPRVAANAWDGARLALYLRRHGIGIVHTHLAWTSRAVAPWAKLAGVPVVVETPHVREGWRQGWKRFYFVDRALDRLLSAYIAVSAANATYLRDEKRLPAEKIKTIINGIDLARFRPRVAGAEDPRAAAGISPSDSLIVCAARLEPQKGHAVLLRAFAAVVERLRSAEPAGHPAPRLVCLGDGSCRAELQSLAGALGIDAHVSFPGHCPRVETWLAIADLFVLPSLYEGLPLAVAEAMASGCAVIATAVDGTPEMIEDGVNGLLVAPNLVDPLTRAMMRLLADSSLRRRLGAAARNDSRRFDRRRQIAATESLYEELDRRAAGRVHWRRLQPARVQAGAKDGAPRQPNDRAGSARIPTVSHSVPAPRGQHG